MADKKVKKEAEAYPSRGKRAAQADSVGQPKPHKLEGKYDRPMAKQPKA